MTLPAAGDLFGILSALTTKHKKYLTNIKYADRLSANQNPRIMSSAC
jgi:hypothetical protein